MDTPDALDVVLRLAVLVLVLGGLVVHALRPRRRRQRPGARYATTLARPLAPAPTVVRALLAFVALGLLGYGLQSFTGSGDGLWTPVLVGVLALGLLWVTVVPLLRDVADAVRPAVVVGTVTDRRRHVYRAFGHDGPYELASFFVTVVDDAGAIREFQLHQHAYRRFARGDQVRLAVAGTSGYVHSIVPAPVGTVTTGGR
ncbi:hypothetical protein [Isoptericola haloaureus]|uniref:DUF3592 domain-containing protein n=1 Tax=Isoptericola haloaureus TaxID=1542902 RepID=A0ABU7ZAI1_9MICO